MVIGLTNAVDVRGRTALRYAVVTRVAEDGSIESAEIGAEPVEEVALPLTRAAAMIFVNRHFEDFDAARMRDLVDRLSRPTGELNSRRTDPMA